MKSIKSLAILICVMMFASESFAQEAKQKPFSITMWGITFTGTYSEGRLYQQSSGGGSILWGLISWGGSTTIDCRTGDGVCKVETIISVNPQLSRTATGENGFEPVVTDGSTPVVVGVKDGALTFAVDITQVRSEARASYMLDHFNLESSFVLGPDVVKYLKLYSGDDAMGYVVPAGKYPLFRDGNIYYWTFEPEQPQK